MRTKTRKNSLSHYLWVFTLMFLMLFGVMARIPPPIVAQAADLEPNSGVSWVQLEETGGQTVIPSQGNVTGNFSIKVPEGMAGSEQLLFRIYRVLDFTYNEQTSSYDVAWTAGRELTTDGDTEYFDWAYEYIRDHYPYYRDDPELLAKASVSIQREVWNALSDFLEEQHMKILFTSYLGSMDESVYPSGNENYHVVLRQGASEGQEYTFTDFPAAGYLVDVGASTLNSNVPITASLLPVRQVNGSWFLSNIQVSMKASDAGIKKSIVVTGDEGGDQVAVGDTVHFRVDVAIPAYGYYYQSVDEESEGEQEDSAAEYEGPRNFDLTDMMSKAFSLKEGTIRFLDQEGRSLTQGINGAVSIPQITHIDDGSTELFARFDYVKLQQDGVTSITLEYDAVVTEQAEVGSDANTNTAALTYVKNIAGETATLEDTVQVWTYGFNLVKFDGATVDIDNTGKIYTNDSTEYLSGAIFTLYKQLGTYVASNMEELQHNADYLSAVANNQTKGALLQIPIYNTNEQIEGYELYLEMKGGIATNADSKGVNVSGIGPGDYLLVEVLAPEGYNRLSEGLKFVIPKAELTGTQEYGKRDSLASITDSNNNKYTSGYYELLVANYKGVQLPQTGGMGTLPYTLVGLALMGIALLKIMKIYHRY